MHELVQQDVPDISGFSLVLLLSLDEAMVLESILSHLPPLPDPPPLPPKPLPSCLLTPLPPSACQPTLHSGLYPATGLLLGKKCTASVRSQSTLASARKPWLPSTPPSRPGQSGRRSRACRSQPNMLRCMSPAQLRTGAQLQSWLPA